jgi:hypothetical protein
VRGEGPHDPAAVVVLGSPRLDRPLPRFGLADLFSPVFVDRLGVDLAQTPIGEEARQMSEAPAMVAKRSFAQLPPSFIQ